MNMSSDMLRNADVITSRLTYGPAIITPYGFTRAADLCLKKSAWKKFFDNIN